MKAKSRRRLLISSVAMLLVAMLALGTATFAWFTQSTSATASGIAVRTSKTSSLEISDDTRGYGSSFTYTDVQPIMLPASSINGSNWFTTFAQTKEAFTKATDATITPVAWNASEQKYVFTDQLNIKNAAVAGGQNVKDIEITISGITNDYIRVALVPVASKNVNVAIPQGTDFKSYVFADSSANSDITGATSSYYPISADGALQTATAITPIQTASGATSITITKSTAGFTDLLTTLAPQAEIHFNVYVWFEGQDADCYDGKAGNGTDGISLSVSGTPVSEV